MMWSCKLAWVSHAGLHARGGPLCGDGRVLADVDGRLRQAHNEIPKVVFFKTLTQADWPSTTIASGNLAAPSSRSTGAPG